MISQNARSIILEIVHNDCYFNIQDLNLEDDNELTSYVFQYLGGIESFELEYEVEFYD